MHSRAIRDANVTYLDEFLLNKDGRVKALSVVALRQLDPAHLMIWMQKNGRYNLPTAELVDWLKLLIEDECGSALEVAAGMGDLGYHLGIPMTDSYVQTSPEMQAYYAAFGAKPIHPPADVEKADAETAVKQHRPQIVIASWLTQKYQPGDESIQPKIGSSIYGADEFEILRNTSTYIHIGNRAVHGDKRLLKIPHITLRGELVSKGFDQSLNEITIWTRFPIPVYPLAEATARWEEAKKWLANFR